MTTVHLAAATTYTDWLIGALTDAASYERAANHRARLADSTPETITVKRYRCPHCGTSRAKQAAARAHIARCWHNPAARTCKTCAHFEPYEPAGGCWGDPYCNCPEVPEGCAVGAGVTGAQYPLTDCPTWEAAP